MKTMCNTDSDSKQIHTPSNSSSNIRSGYSSGTMPLFEDAPAMSCESSNPPEPASSNPPEPASSNPPEVARLDSSMSIASTCSTGYGTLGSEVEAEGYDDDDNENNDDFVHIDLYSSSEMSTKSEISLKFAVSESETSLPRTLFPQIRTTVEIPEVISSSAGLGSKVTLYKINVESSDICFHLPSSCVWRSYSDFVWLRRRIASSCSLMKSSIPALPPRRLLSIFDKDFTESRKKGLEEFLKQVVADRSLLSDAALHLFLQSNLSAGEIQRWLDGKVDGSVLDIVQQGMGVETRPNVPLQTD